MALLAEVAGAEQCFINAVLVIMLRVNVVHYFGASGRFYKEYNVIILH